MNHRSVINCRRDLVTLNRTQTLRLGPLDGLRIDVRFGFGFGFGLLRINDIGVIVNDDLSFGFDPSGQLLGVSLTLDRSLVNLRAPCTSAASSTAAATSSPSTDPRPSDSLGCYVHLTSRRRHRRRRARR